MKRPTSAQILRVGQAAGLVASVFAGVSAGPLILRLIGGVNREGEEVRFSDADYEEAKAEAEAALKGAKAELSVAESEVERELEARRRREKEE